MKTKITVIAFLLTIYTLTLSTTSVAQKLRVACIGNSVTYGYGLSKPDANYPTQLQKMLGDRYNVQNFGVSGSTLLRKGHKPYVNTEAFQEAVQFAPDIAVIHLGLNDTDPRNWPNYRDSFVSDYFHLIDTLRKTNPDVEIYVCSLTPIFSGHPRFKSGTRDWYWQIQEKITKISQHEKINFIDLNRTLRSRPDLFPDNLHPNEQGYHLIANTVYKSLTKYYGTLQLAPSFMDHMVLQREQPVPVFGTAEPETTITIQFDNEKLQSIADTQGQWRVEFPAKKAGGPHSLIVTAKEQQIRKDNILFGDVWLLSGQSNMEFPLQNAIRSTLNSEKEEISPNIRLLHYQGTPGTNDAIWREEDLEKVNNLTYFDGTWQPLSLDAANHFSAVGYSFGKTLEDSLSIPIGLIQLAVGGSGMESWIDRQTLENHPLLVDMVDSWRKSDFIMPWVRERTDKNLQLADNIRARHPFQPVYNFEAGIQKLEGIRLRGVVWYQGESNAHNPELYETLFNSWVKSWRRHFRNDTLPIYYVQLSGIQRPDWPTFRNTQRLLQQRNANIYMAVSYDLGDSLDVHPKDKIPIGQRLADKALHHSYGFKTKATKTTRATIELIQNTAVMKFDSSVHLSTKADLSPKGFLGISSKGEVIPLSVSVQSNHIVIPLHVDHDIQIIRYAWEPYTPANIYLNHIHPLTTFEWKISDEATIIL